MTIECIPATSDDIPVILEMMVEFYRQEGIPFDADQSRKTLEDFISKKDIGEIWMIQAQNKPAGYCCMVLSYTLEYHGPDCFLDELYVKPEFQHQGVGSKVMQFVEIYARRQNYKAIHLFVFDKNKNAFDFYVHKGFKKRDGSLMVKLLE